MWRVFLKKKFSNACLNSRPKNKYFFNAKLLGHWGGVRAGSCHEGSCTVGSASSLYVRARKSDINAAAILNLAFSVSAMLHTIITRCTVIRIPSRLILVELRLYVTNVLTI